MRYKLLSVTALVATFLGASAATAQGASGAAQERRTERREKLKHMTPDERKAALEKAKDHRENRREHATDAQKAWAKLYGVEVKATREGVKAGTLTRESAAHQLQAWRAAHPRP